MKSIFLAILFSFISFPYSYAQVGPGGFTPRSVQKVTDGSTTCYPYQLNFSSISSCINGIATIANGGGGGNIGIGTTNDVTYWGPGNTLQASNSLQFINIPAGPTLGIGTANPDTNQYLDVGGSVHINHGSFTLTEQLGATFQVLGPDPSNAILMELGDPLADSPIFLNGGSVVINNASNPQRLGLYVFDNVGIGTFNNQNAALSVMSGNVGIGTWIPAQALDVLGTARMTGLTMTTAPTTGYVLTATDSTGDSAWSIGPVTPGRTGQEAVYLNPTTINSGSISDTGSYSSSYLGLIATRGEEPFAFTAVNKQLMSRSPHFSTQAITALEIAIPNWYILTGTTFAETGTGGTATVTASVEYPAGTFTQITFNSGSTSGTIPSGETIFSDMVNVSIPTQTEFWIRIYFTDASGLVFENLQPVSGIGSGNNAGVSGIADLTMGGGSIASSNTHLSPLAIIGQTTNASIVILGDSRCVGFGDTTADPTGNYGDITKSFGFNYGYASFCRYGDLLNFSGNGFLNSNSQRSLILPFASTIVNAYQYNDINAKGNSLVNAEANEQAIHTIAHNLGSRIYDITIGPQTNSTDNWSTLVNQTVVSGTNESIRLAFNAWIRRGTSGQDGYFDISSQNESSLNSGLWVVNGSSDYATTDGIHENSVENQLIASSGIINPNFASGQTPFSYGNVGIGTSSPSANLDVVGSIRANNSTNTGFLQLSVNSTGVSTIEGGTSFSPIALNPNGGGSQGFVGIGTSMPDAQLSITSGTGTSGTTAISLKNYNGREYEIGDNGSAGSQSPNGLFIRDVTSSATRMVLNSSGNIGIGSISPGKSLDVAGTIRMTGFQLTTSPTSAYVLTATDNAGDAAWKPSTGSSQWTTTNTNDVYLPNNGNVGLGTTITSAGSALSVMNGNVGIGTWVPINLLDVNGTIRQTGFTLTGNGAASGFILQSNGSQGIGTWVPEPTGSGTVTSVTFTGDGILDSSTPSSAVTTSGTLTASPISQAINVILAGPSSGSSANPTFRSLVGADLPNPSSTTLGGIESKAAVSHQWINSISTSGIPSLTAPAQADVTGLTTASSPTFAGLALTGNITQIGGNANATLTATALQLVNTGASTTIKGNASGSSGSFVAYEGSAATNGFIEIRSTTGVGSGDFVKITGGNNGATEIARFLGTGNVGIGTTIPQGSLVVMSGNTGIGTWIPGSILDVEGGNVGIGSNNAGQFLDVKGTIRVSALGSTISIVQGTNACAGTAALSTGTVTVSTNCTPSSANGFIITDLGGGVLANIGSLSIGTVTGGTSFVINSSNALDSSNVYWEIHKPTS